MNISTIFYFSKSITIIYNTVAYEMMLFGNYLPKYNALVESAEKFINGMVHSSL